VKKKQPKPPAEPFKYSPKVTLHPGDVFRCSGGPYYVTQTGEKLAMGQRGLFSYVNIAQDGILAVPYKPRPSAVLTGSAIVFIYMGEEKVSETTGTNFCPHKIRKVRKKASK
jgi:hypothetical protein